MGDLPYKIPDKKKKDSEKKDIVEVDNVGRVDNIENVPVPSSGKVYSQEEVDNILKKREQVKSGGDDDDNEFGMNSKLLKNLQNTVGVFNALKEFSSNPLTRSIETKIGERAAIIVDQAFGAPQGGGGKKDILDMVLNSQMAYGFGQGLGARGPEFVETLGKTFGKERIDKFADSMIDQYGKGGGGGGGRGTGLGSGNAGVNNGGSGAGSGVKNESSQRDLLMTLDPNNPEHVAAYADSQGGIRTDVARKMLMIHQDDFIKQMEEQGLDVSGFDRKNSGQDSEMLRLRAEQQEILRMKREAERQLNELDKGRTTQEKVVSFKDIKSKGEKEEKEEKGEKEDIVEKVAEIPDKWDVNDLNEVEKESIANADRERLLANIRKSTGTVTANTEEMKAVDTVIEPKKEVNIPIIPEEDAVDMVMEPVIDMVMEPVIDMVMEPVIDMVMEPVQSIIDISKIDMEKVSNGNSTVNSTAMCPKCRKIRLLFETEKGKMCGICKQKRGL